LFDHKLVENYFSKYVRVSTGIFVHFLSSINFCRILPHVIPATTTTSENFSCNSTQNIIKFHNILLNNFFHQFMLENELFLYKQHVEKLEKFQRQLEEGWKKVRWVTQVVSAARNKASDGQSVSLSALQPRCKRYHKFLAFPTHHFSQVTTK